MSNNLNLPQLTASQTQKEVTINSQAGILDAALTETFLLSGDSPTVSASEFREAIVLTTAGDQTVDIAVTIPQIKKLFCVDNTNSSYAIDLDRGTTTVTVAAGQTQILYTDGTADGLATFATEPAQKTVSFYAEGTIAASEVIGSAVMSSTFVLPASAPSAQAYAATASAAAYSFDIIKNESVTVGTVNFALGVNAATFTVASATTFNAGDRISIKGASVADGSLADVSITFVGA